MTLMKGRHVAGWFGKMPSLGDFSQHGLSTNFVSLWDDWLAHCMLASRSMLGDDWLDAYLNSPIWRFILLSGVVDENSWAGILMPSVDKVGRYFPLTLSIAIPQQSNDTGFSIARSIAWVESLEQIALDILEPGMSPNELALRLDATPYPDADQEGLQKAGAFARMLHSRNSSKLTLRSVSAIPELFTEAAEHLLLQASAGKSFWWTQANPDAIPILEIQQGLPPPESFQVMLRP